MLDDGSQLQSTLADQVYRVQSRMIYYRLQNNFLFWSKISFLCNLRRTLCHTWHDTVQSFWDICNRTYTPALHIVMDALALWTKYRTWSSIDWFVHLECEIDCDETTRIFARFGDKQYLRQSCYDAIALWESIMCRFLLRFEFGKN